MFVLEQLHIQLSLYMYLMYIIYKHFARKLNVQVSIVVIQLFLDEIPLLTCTFQGQTLRVSMGFIRLCYPIKDIGLIQKIINSKLRENIVIPLRL